MRALVTALRSLIARGRFERTMRDELRAHIELRADDLAATGLPREEARRRAHVEFGAMEAYKEQCRDAGGFAPWRPLHGFGGDIRLAARRLAATPMFTVFAVLSLAIGLGVTTAAYSVVTSLFFAPSGVADEEHVIKLATRWEGRLVAGGMSQPDYDDVRRAARSFSTLTASAGLDVAVETPISTDLMRVEAVDGHYFATLGARAALGRTIDQQDVAAAHPVVVLSHDLWKLRFEADAAIVGRTIRVAGRSLEVVGVAAAGFFGREDRLNATRLWLPLSLDPRQAPAGTSERDRQRLVVIGRLTPGVTMQAASAELEAIGASLDAAYPRRNAAGPAARNWTALSFDNDDDILPRFGLAFVALVALVLVVACTNLANLVLSRGTSRRHEFAMRRALGASRWRLVREQCAESLLLAVAGLGAAWLVFNGLRAALDIDLPFASRFLISFRPELDLNVVSVAGAALLLSLFVFGLEPALRLTRDRQLRPDVVSAAGTTGARQSVRQRRLVRWQVAVSTGFFVLATLSVNYIAAEARHDSGVDLDRLALATMNFQVQQWDEDRSTRALARVLEEVDKGVEVQSAAIATGMPFGASNTPRFLIAPAGVALTDAARARPAFAVAATPRIFHTLGIPILQGRGFDDRDGAGARPVVVLSEQTARRLFGTAAAVGREIQFEPRGDDGPRRRTVAGKLGLRVPASQAAATAEPQLGTVIGIARDTDVGALFQRRDDLFYMPLAQQSSATMFGIAVVRTDGSPHAALRGLRDAIRRVDPALAVESSGSGELTLGGPTIFLRTAALLAVSLGALTLILSMVGLHGVQAHGVAERTREFGVRMSLGATTSQIYALVLKDGYRPVAQGLAIGLLFGFLGRGLVRAFWWEGMAIADAWMVVALPPPLLLAAFFACWLPARRASRVDPNVALRHL